MASNRRIRCFSCKKLVFSKIDYYNPDAAYSVVPIYFGNKRGCVCSECIEHYSNDNDFLDSPVAPVSELPENKRMEFLFGPFWPKSLQNNTPIIKYKNAPESSESVESNNSELSKVTTNNNKNGKDDTSKFEQDEASKIDEYTKIFTSKYSCLDYSLDSYVKLVQNTVFGQDEALKRLVYTIYFNQLSNCLEEYSDMLPSDLVNCLGREKRLPRRKHVLLIGGTGVGKTLLATTVAKMFNITYSISNATPITSAGYIGDKVEYVLERLYDAAKGDIHLAENGIIILDEFDKKAVSPDNSSKDVTGKAVQQELLKLLEPSEVWIKKSTVRFNTNNLTIIMMGAFVGLEDVINNRLKVKKIGFGNTDTSVSLNNLIPDDLIEYGFIPEIVGRIPIIIKLNDLTKDVLTEIVYALLNKYNAFFKYKHYDLIVDPLLIDKLVTESLKAKTGARDLDTKVDELLQPALYQVFQSLANGVCEIHSDGSIALLTSDKKSNTPIIMEIPPVKKYEDSNDNELSGQ